MRNTAGVQILGFLTILFFILFLYKYLTEHDIQSDIPQYDAPVMNTMRPIKAVKQPHTTDSDDIIDDTINLNANDLQIVNNKFNLYNGNQEIINYGFVNELANKDIINKTFAPELDELYEETQNMISNKNGLNEENTFHNSCSTSKPQKSDLPIANVPVYLLDKNLPLRLSEKPQL